MVGLKKIKGVFLLQKKKLKIKFQEQSDFRQFKRRSYKIPPVLIYQMGKVGSSSLYYSLKEQYPGICEHAHYFSSDHFKKEIVWLKKMYDKKNIRLKVITMVREPIERNISAFFQNFERDTNIQFTKDKFGSLEIKSLFIDNFPHSESIAWFDNVFKKDLGIDIYEHDFSDQKWNIIKTQGVDILIYQYDIPDSIKIQLVKNFLLIKQFYLKNENLSSEKIYSNEYENLKNSSFEKDFLDSLLNSKYVDKFYKDEKRELYRKWMK